MPSFRRLRSSFALTLGLLIALLTAACGGATPPPMTAENPGSTVLQAVTTTEPALQQVAQVRQTATATPTPRTRRTATATPAPQVRRTATPAPAQAQITGNFGTTIQEVADAVKPAVVLITNVGAPPAEALRPIPGQVQGIGSGVIIDPAGYIVTNNHVIEGAQSLQVVLPDGRTFDGTVVGRDPRTDLAVVKIEGDNLPTAPLASDLNINVGSWVVAIGNALGLPGGPTVTAGVVGAIGRTIDTPTGVSLEDLIQTDAAINPGNSGGPLVSLNGEVVGINTAGIQGAEGLGFAISANTVQEVVPQLIAEGRVVRPFIGISPVPITPGLAARFDLPREEGLLIARVVPDSPAAQAGIETGDILVSVSGQQVTSPAELEDILAQFQPGEELTLTVLRNGQTQEITLTLAETPPPGS